HAREENVRVYFCPSRRGPTMLSVNERNNCPGGLSDYAACEGNGFQADLPTANGALVTATSHIFADREGSQRLMRWSSVTKLSSITDGLSNTLLVGEKHVPAHRFGQGPWDSSVYNAHSTAGPVYRRAGREWNTTQQPSPRGVNADVTRDLPLIQDRADDSRD